MTVTEPAVPAVEPERPVRARCEAVAGVIATPDSEPTMLPVTVSVAVTDCVPAVLRVTSKVPTPLASVASAGRTAWPSLLVKCTVPA